MSMENLYGILPNHQDLAGLAAQAQAINAAAAQGDISGEEHHALLQDLVRTQVIQGEAQTHEHKLFADQVVAVLSRLPLP